MKSTKDITWSALIPLIGGFPLGAEAELNKPPEQIIGYGFPHDNQYIHYQEEVLGRKMDKVVLNEEGVVISGNALKHVNIIVATPPCSALSSLNCGKCNSVKGATAESTKWMDYALRESLGTIKCDVFMLENAPALASNKGAEMAKRLSETANQYGYSSGYYKTSTKHHGIPQNRQRTFFFAWKSDRAPELPWVRKPRENFKTFLENIPSDLTQQDLIINTKVTSEPYYIYMKDKLNLDVRSAMIESGLKTTLQYVMKRDDIEKALAYFNETNNELGIKLASHVIKKKAMGLGVWDGSVHVFDDTMNALIGRNMNDTIHPSHDRSLNVREALCLMGFPEDFELQGGLKNTNMIAQNVPACTAADMVMFACMFINRELQTSNSNVIFQNNENKKHLPVTFKSDIIAVDELASPMEELFTK